MANRRKKIGKKIMEMKRRLHTVNEDFAAWITAVAMDNSGGRA